jgi:hypothetical protein
MSDKKGWSEEKTDWAGNKYIQHYDEDGQKDGWSEVKSGILGGDYVQHHDQDGNKIGYSENKSSFASGDYTQHHDQDGNKTGYSENKSSFVSGDYTQHHDQSGTETGYSEERQRALLGNYTQHHGYSAGRGSKAARASESHADSDYDLSDESLDADEGARYAQIDQPYGSARPSRFIFWTVVLLASLVAAAFMATRGLSPPSRGPVQAEPSAQDAEGAWGRVDGSLANLKTLGSSEFNALFSLCETSLLPESVRRSGRYKFAQALKLWVDGRRTSAIEKLAAIASSGGDSFEASRAREILAPPAPGKREVHGATPFHFRTWSRGSLGSVGASDGRGVYIQLVGYEVYSDRLTVSFSARSGAHKELLLYAPRTIREGFSNCESLYVLDDNGQRFYSTNGWRGGRQSRLNSCATQISFGPNEEVILTAEFPMVSRGATSMRLISPDPDNAGHQSEWSWQGIQLKSGPFD